MKSEARQDIQSVVTKGGAQQGGVPPTVQRGSPAVRLKCKEMI